MKFAPKLLAAALCFGLVGQAFATDLKHWPADQAKALDAMIAANAHKGNFAVFDMDNTSYRYDLEESLLPFMENKGLITRDKLDPSLKLIPFKDTADHKESLFSYYYRLCEIDDMVCYPWVAQVFSGFTLKELKGYVDELMASGKPVPATYYEGDVVKNIDVQPPKVFTGQAELYNKLMENGIEVYVMTAASEELVRMVAADPKYGYNVKPQNVIGVTTLLKNRETGELTTARTAATTAVAVDALAPSNAKRLAIIGSGKVAQAHLHYARNLRDWQSINVYSPSLSEDGATASLLQALDPRVQITDSRETAIADADVIMLCTSSAGPVIDPATLSKPALITSISTNAPRAHEVPPQSLNDMQVFCDYRLTTPGSAGEMLIASEQHGWDCAAILGDLPELLSGQARRPSAERHVFFRSIGLGLEDIALANALYHLQRQP